MRRHSIAMISLGLGLLTSAGSHAATPPRTAVFDFEFVDTSLEAPTPDELRRIGMVGDEARDILQKSGRYDVVDTAPIRAKMQAASGIRECNGCELDYAKQLKASVAVYGWVQKVSNLILNVNLVVEDVATGKRITNGSVDIRGNTDESWQRGIKYLLENQILDQ